ncbi:MAG: endonuclease NucS, partial [Candidatus Tectomicrobia bacterium]|nr:endonuclease NucS [Candidatus Tectomicrobia bacterium]
MPDEVSLWQIGSDDSLHEIERGALDLEARLQGWLARDISVLDPELLVIGREVETDFGGYIDLLCIDSAGDLVAIELKRDRTPREITAQILDYGSWVDGLSH